MSAREDRAKRRQERRASTGGDEARAQERVRPADSQRQARSDTPSTVGEPTKEGGRGALNFTRQSIGELKKVEWPGQTQVVQATTVVLIACVIVGAWLYANDFIWQRVFKNFLLK